MLISDKLIKSATTILTVLSCIVLTGCSEIPAKPSQTYNPTQNYLERVIDAERVDDPQVVFLLMLQYINSNQLKTGIDYFESALRKHRSELTPNGRAI